MSPSKQSQRSRRPARRSLAKPWLVVAVGLGLGLFAAYVLLSDWRAPEAGKHAQRAEEPAHGDIGDASRAKMREILREADEQGARP